MFFFGEKQEKTKSPRKDNEFNYIDSRNIVQRNTRELFGALEL